jgi:hypothetical protein
MIIVAIFIAYPTETPMILLGKGIKSDSTTIARIDQKARRPIGPMLKLRARYMYNVIAKATRNPRYTLVLVLIPMPISPYIDNAG